MESTQLVDCAGRRRSPAALPGYHRGRPPRNKGLRYPLKFAGSEINAFRLDGDPGGTFHRLMRWEHPLRRDYSSLGVRRLAASAHTAGADPP
jgi:hypothetical protein